MDVHALKGHRKACGTRPQPEGPGPGSDPGSSSGTNPSVDSKPDLDDPVAGGESSTSAGGGVSPNSGGQSSHGILAAAAGVSRGSLPFTGFPLWGVVLAALVLIMTGLSLRRRSRLTH